MITSGAAQIFVPGQLGADVVTTPKILDGTILGADISATADIALSKLHNAASSGANSDITSLSGLTTPLSVAQGGLGVGTLAIHGVLIGNTQGAVQVTAPGSAGQVLKSGGAGADPSWGSSVAYTYSAGTVVFLSALTERSTIANVFTELKRFTFGSFISGVVRVAWDGKSVDGAHTTHQRVYLNGAGAAAEHTEATGVYTTFSDDIAISPGDYISIYAYDATANSSWVKNAYIKVLEVTNNVVTTD